MQSTSERINGNDCFLQLSQSIEQNQTWEPEIYIKSSHFYHQDNAKEDGSGGIGVLNGGQDAQLVNVSRFLDESIFKSVTLSAFRQNVLNYPTNAVLQLEGFFGVEEEKEVIKALKNAALVGGTTLVVERVKSASTNRLKQIMLTCDHYRHSRGNKKMFEAGKHQLPGSKYQAEHGASKEKQDKTAVNRRKVTSVRSICESDHCMFAFHIFCSASAGSEGKWYVSAVGGTSKTMRSKHTNHLPVSSSHLAVSMTQLSETAMDDIKLKICNGTTPAAIVSEVRDKYRISISPKQIFRMRQTIIHELVQNAGENPSNSAAERLLQVFRTYEDVTYVYVKHRMDSGFVTYSKKRGKSIQTIENGIDNNEEAVTLDEVSLWRKELKLTDTNEILVSFAWSHNEEYRKLCMFPEFVATDLTFGVNRQRRPLLVISGVDGENRTFTGFRCFMPSNC